MQGKLEFLHGHFHESAAYVRLEALISSVAREGMLAAEIGCFTGRTAFCALPCVREHNGLMYLIDWFKGSGVGRIWPPRNQTLGTLLDNLETEGFLDHAIIMVGNSIDAAKALSREQILDYLYIGADHRYAQFSADVDTWWPRLKSGGVMCGHGLDRRIEKDGPEWQKCLDCCDVDWAAGVHWGIARLLAERFPDYESEANMWWVKKS